MQKIVQKKVDQIEDNQIEDNQIEVQKIEVQDVEMEMEIVQIVQRIDSPVLVSRVVLVVVVVPNERYSVESLQLSLISLQLESLSLQLESLSLQLESLDLSFEVIGLDILEVKLGWVVSLQLLEVFGLERRLERLDLQLLLAHMTILTEEVLSFLFFQFDLPNLPKIVFVVI